MAGVPVSWPLICQGVVLGTGVAVPGTGVRVTPGVPDPLGEDDDVESSPQATKARQASTTMVSRAKRRNMLVLW